MTTLRETGEALGLTVTKPYRIGLGWDLERLCTHLALFGRWRAAPHRNWRGVRYTLKLMAKSARRRSWWGIWQCEGSLGLNARRGLTARAAERRMLRDEINAALSQNGGTYRG
ncbi:hypothetical protein ABZW11_26510 [Nonomuraea sp. NPDC004580]|uniref:hypothetical protein n=1 Tax=Nonomuraea sp. NPDC004580 TaxID=3154552 RepID=UPI0033A3595D